MTIRRRSPIQIAAVLILAIVGFVFAIASTTHAAEVCWVDADTGTIYCEDEGVIPVPGGAPTPGLQPGDDPGLRYVYTSTDPGIGDCYYWSDVPGGLDAWDPANDGAVIAITTSLPLCPAIDPTDPEARAWQIFRSWTLAVPAPELTPEGSGITGIATVLSTPAPPAVTHSEILPDGRPLDVRARVAILTVLWGDGTTTDHAASDATPYPEGSVSHAFTHKTCTADYRANHPSGSLCHPTLDHYEIEARYVWTGEYATVSGWIVLGALTTTSTVSYDVDEARGVTIP
ncbi:MAG: hypothetical protein ACR2N2_05615 [Acidimicrobiia bacterium]